MKNIDHEIGTVLDLVMHVNDIAAKDGNAWNTALLAWQIIAPDGIVPPRAAPSCMKHCVRLAMRILSVMPGQDEPRFSMYDYADAVANAARTVSVRKLVYLDGDQAFADVMIRLAELKRETYSEQEHMLPEPDADIWEDPA